jgi:hypothetical protein
MYRGWGCCSSSALDSRMELVFTYGTGTFYYGSGSNEGFLIEFYDID